MNEIIRLLVLEDEDADRMIVRELLAEYGRARFVVRFAGTVADLHEALIDETPDLILCDLCVPDSEGLQTFLRVYEMAPAVPIVVQSGLSDEQIALSAVRRGAQEYLVKPHRDADGLARALLHAIERHRAKAALRASEERYMLAVNGANDGLWDWNLDSGHLYLSPRFKRLLGYGPDELPSTTEAWFDAVHPDDYPAFASAIDAHLRGHAAHLQHEHRMRTRCGGEVWVLSRGLAVLDDAGRPVRMAGSLTDISSRKQAEDRLRHNALHDQLTGLANRTLCLDRLRQALRRADRFPEHRVGLLFVDLDRFKTVNDSLGHAAGDRLLCAFARRCAAVIRPSDTFARFGGDEFCVVLDGMRSAHDAERVARRIHAVLREPFDIDGEEVYTSASIGICLRGPGHTDAEELVRDADIAMYRAKAGGRACNETYDPELHRSARARLGLETDLRRALDRGEFVLHYQPIVALHDERLHGVEALLRWHSADRGIISPIDFIPLAEETGLIVPIGRWVLDTAVRTMALWDLQLEEGAEPLQVSVNVSPRQLMDTELPALVAAVLSETGISPHRLALEITENCLMDHMHQAEDILSGLRDLGVGVHLDDFGTGFSSLTYLQRLPIDCLKIDRSFVSGIVEHPADLAIVRAIVELGHNLGKHVVAEGIETGDQLRVLRELGCEYGQGYYWSRPAAGRPASEAYTVQDVAA